MLSTIHRCWFACLVALVALRSPALFAQPRAPLPRLDAESIQAQTRLNGIQRQVQPGTDNQSISLLLGQAQPTLEGLLASLPALQVHDMEKWDDALNELRELVEDLGDGLVPLPESPMSTVAPPLISVRRYANFLLSQWPRSIREKHHLRAEKVIAGLLEQGLATRSERTLRRVVDEAAGSPSAAKALDALGDIAFFKGRLRDALAWWSMLAPLPNRMDEEGISLFSDASIQRPSVHAKQVLALAYLGELSEAKRQRDAFARRFPEAEGNLAGKKGTLVKLLDELLQKFIESGDLALETNWSTLGGNAARGAVKPLCPPSRLWIDGPTWKVALPEAPRTAKKEGGVFEPVRPLYHPLVIGDQVILTDSQSVTAYHLGSGKQVFRQTFAEAMNPAPSAESPAYTASAEGGLLVLRVGQPPDRETHLKKPAEHTWLVGVELGAVDKGSRIRWQVSVPVENRAEAFFNGPPLIHNGKVWVSYQAWKGSSLFQGIASLNPETGRWLTNTSIGKAPVLPPGRDTTRQPVLLTAAGNAIVACTQRGSVVALDNHTGKIAWGLRYASQGPWTRLTTPRAPDLSAPLFALNRIYTAPQDADVLLCLDSQTGQVVWEREILDVVHLLGCSQGKLIFTTSTGLRTVSAETGSDRAGWMMPQSGRVIPQGRGLILGEWVFWPTKDPTATVRVFSVAQGRPELDEEVPQPWDRGSPLFFGITMLRHLPAGNMAFGQDSLFIATEKELVGFVSPRLLLKERKDQAQRENTPLATFLLAQSLADAGQHAEAEALLRSLSADHMGDWGFLARDRLFGEWTDHPKFAWRMEPPLRTEKALKGRPKKTMSSPKVPTWTLPLHERFVLDNAALATSSPKAEPPGASVIFVYRQGKARCVDALTGEELWSVPWPGAPTWSGLHEDRALLAGPDLIESITLKQGEPVWSFPNPMRSYDRFILEEGRPWFFSEPGHFERFTLEDDTLSFSIRGEEWRVALATGLRHSRSEGPPHSEATTPDVSTDGPALFTGMKDTLTSTDRNTGAALWEAKLPIAADAWSFQLYNGVLIAHPRGDTRIRPSALDFFPALALAWQQKNRIARDDAHFFLLDPVLGRILQRIKLDRGPGPYSAQSHRSGLVVSNGRDIAGFVVGPLKSR